ncbi:hypothetical protein [Caulobacter hibisci]|uniref:Uncharacterized protein n=1 Tax=Caulobacter hibisci TaxID=2035993 RepID=A0ABS0ST44_9CAUL|nr:hypothetical protein [Caulobacter hibisci]MBI1682381.1 hypothetical protein [Caulobacter hibisci]
MHKLKNITAGPKGARLADGSLVHIAPGTVEEDLDIAKEELAVLKKTGWFQIDGAIKDEPEAKTDDAEALAYLERAETAEGALTAANAEIEALKAKLAEAGKAGGKA